MFARYGGEEFVLLLPRANRKAALEIAEKCRSAVIKLGIPHKVSNAADIVTISIGVNTIIPTQNTDPFSLFAGADRMLYQAKNCGRNRVEAVC